ncbi:MAG: hypothetical protein JXA03_00780 [Bacteroidales bacterium]|nr:hypothetical protein [Bacteroidales bacterium]
MMTIIKNTLIILAILLIIMQPAVKAQDDLMDLLGDDPETVDYAYATFKATRIVNAQSVENPAPGVLLFMIQHRFGQLNSGAYELWGLDNATIRLGLEYGVTERLAFGIGRSSFNKTFDGFLKYKILRQSSGLHNMPVTLSYYASATVTSLTWADQGVPDRTNYNSSRWAYTHQLLLARKFSSSFSLQLMPTIVHKNLVPTIEDQNTIFSAGIGGRYKLTNRMSVNMEYFYTPTEQTSYLFDQPLSIGFDIETGGHVFQLHFSNAKAFFDDGFITATRGKWENADIYFGFNISRVFTIKKPDTFKE